MKSDKSIGAAECRQKITHTPSTLSISCDLLLKPLLQSYGLIQAPFSKPLSHSFPLWPPSALLPHSNVHLISIILISGPPMLLQGSFSCRIHMLPTLTMLAATTWMSASQLVRKVIYSLFLGGLPISISSPSKVSENLSTPDYHMACILTGSLHSVLLHFTIMNSIQHSQQVTEPLPLEACQLCCQHNYLALPFATESHRKRKSAEKFRTPQWWGAREPNDNELVLPAVCILISVESPEFFVH